MKRSIFLIAVVLAALTMGAQLTLVVDQIPANTPEGDPIYVAGSFNGWDPGDPAHELMVNLDGDYEITIDPAPGTLEFKFTRGSWDTVEGNEFGGYLPNRIYEYPGGEATVIFQILTWEDVGGTNSTAADNVEVIDDEFYMPQLDRYRRIWVYLPPDYDDTDNDYKVLYMHDGQNVFDLATSFAGEWEVDETLNDLFAQGDEGCIVVGIDNGGIHRLDEYSPWYNSQFEAGGEGEEYMQFLVETLKPYIDENYRTLTDREWTGLMGSSMGGFISTFGGIQHSDVFSRIGSFSPSYWFAWNDVVDFIETTAHPDPMRIYSIAGELEGGSMAADAETIDDLYGESGYDEDEHLTVIHDDGEHSEWYWAREFEAAYLWLWASEVGVEENDVLRFSIYPNPASDEIIISGTSGEGVLEIFQASGELVLSTQPNGSPVDITLLDPGSYICRFTCNAGTSSRKLVIK